MKKPTTITEACLCLGTLLVLVLSPTQYSITLLGKINLSIVDPLVWLLGGILGLRILFKRDVQLLGKLPAAGLLFLLFCFASLLKSSARLEGVKDLIQYLEYFLLAFLLFAHCFRRAGLNRRFVMIFCAVSTLILLLGLGQYLRLEGVDEFMVRGTFGNRNVLGGFLCLYLPLALSLALCPAAPHWLRVWQAVSFAIGLILLLSGGALVACLAAAAMTVCVCRTKTAWTAAAVASLVLMFGFPHLPRQNLWQAHDSIAFFTPEGEPAMRYPEWQAAVAMAAGNPLLGTGIGSYQTHVGQYFGAVPSENIKAEADSQNLYLVIASSMGVPAALCFCLLVFGRFATGLSAFFQNPNTLAGWICLGASVSLLAFAVASLWSPLLVRGIGIPLAFMLALATQCSLAGACGAGSTTRTGNGSVADPV